MVKPRESHVVSVFCRPSAAGNATVRAGAVWWEFVSLQLLQLRTSHVVAFDCMSACQVGLGFHCIGGPTKVAHTGAGSGL